jgi:glucose/arabinose dehydrogenase
MDETVTTPDRNARRAALRTLWSFAVIGAIGASGCSGDGESSPPPAATPPAPTPPSPTPPSPPAPAAAPPSATTFSTGLVSPWGLAFLPDGRILVTQKAGQLRLVSADGATASTVTVTLPGGVDASGQGGLLDVAIDPDFASGSPWVYLSYSQPGTGGTGTAVMRGQLSLANPTALTSPVQIFQQLPKVGGSGHYGSRLVFANDKTLFVTLGERQMGSPAQDTASHLGKVARINRDGSTPSGNPPFGAGQATNLWSMGHRNPQGAALHPVTGELWVGEHGPQGGDEINIARAGNNFGWPNVSYGCNYGSTYPGTDNSSCRIGGNAGVHAPTYVEPLNYWVPVSIAPAGMTFYTGAMFPEWQGSLFVGALAGQALWRLTISGAHNAITAREKILESSIAERIRDVAQGPDGALYLITDSSSGRIIRVAR